MNTAMLKALEETRKIWAGKRDVQVDCPLCEDANTRPGEYCSSCACVVLLGQDCVALYESCKDGRYYRDRRKALRNLDRMIKLVKEGKGE